MHTRTIRTIRRRPTRTNYTSKRTQLLRITLVSLGLVVGGLMSNHAVAEGKKTVKDKRIIKIATQKLAERVKNVNKVCGSSLKVQFDWQSFKRADALNLTSVSACQSQVERAGRVCKDDVGKQAFAATLKVMRCAYAAKEERSHNLSGSTLVEAYWVKSGKGGEYLTQNKPLLEVYLAEKL